MISFHGDNKIKQKYINRIDAHAAADQIVKGQYWQNGKGCAVGCTVHSNKHSAYETELGIPRILARLEDGIFEHLPNDLAMTWPKRFLDAVPVGVDLSNVWDQFAVWMLINKKWGVIQFAKTPAQRAAIFGVAKLYKRKLLGESISYEMWMDVRRPAYAAAADAAYAAAAYAAAYAAAAYAAYAAYAAAAYAADAAADAADAAADADAADADAAAADADADAAADAAAAAADAAAAAARIKWRIAQSEKLIKLLKAAKQSHKASEVMNG